MAPKGGGGKGGGGGGGGKGSSSSSSSCTVSNPCSSPLQFMYGQSYTSLYTSTETYGQLIVFAIYLLLLAGFYIALRKSKAITIRAVLLSFIISFAFLVVRYGFILGGMNVPLGYRHESSIAILFWRLGMPLLFFCVAKELAPALIFKIAAFAGVAVYAVLSIVYAILDFFVSAQGVTHFKDKKDWWLADRDFALTMDPSMIKKLKISSLGGTNALAPTYIRDRMLSFAAIKALKDRQTVIYLGLAADYVGLVVAGLILGIAALRFLKRKREAYQGTTLLITASAGLLLTNLFRIIVSTHYILHNWVVVNNVKKWSDWVASYGTLVAGKAITAPDGFLNGYRTTIPAFPIVAAVIEQLGVVVAAVCVVLVVIKTRRVVVENVSGKA